MQKIPDFLIDLLKKQYEEKNVENILNGYRINRKTTLRVNTIKSNTNKIKVELDKLNINYKEVLWSDNALILENATEKEIQSMEIYENGEIYLQNLSSMLPPIILNPQPNTDILDMAAAPGGKTTQIAALTQNKSHITACEMNFSRAERLKYNINKQGATCIYVMQSDSRKIDNFFSFDSILLDSPCSGSGTLNFNYFNSIQYFTKQLIEKSTKTQISLLKKAINILKPGKEMVYSTCSILCNENEDIVKQILKQENAEIVPIDFKGIESLPRLPVKIDGTLCICPDELYEGFFVAKIRKK